MERGKLVEMTAEIVSSYVAANRIATTEIPMVINEVFRALAGTGQPKGETARPEPAVPIKKSVTPEYIVCLEDGKKLKMLKRHLRGVYGMSPDEYRAKWGLPSDYPMTAPAYAAKRSAFAKQIGLGTKGRAAGEEKGALDADADADTPAPAATRGRRRKAA